MAKYGLNVQSRDGGRIQPPSHNLHQIMGVQEELSDFDLKDHA